MHIYTYTCIHVHTYVQIDGLLLQGAECAPPQGLHPLPADASTLSVMPPLHLTWVTSEAPEPYPADRSAVLPLYLDPDRELQVAELRVPCSGTEASWLQVGAARATVARVSMTRRASLSSQPPRMLRRWRRRDVRLGPSRCHQVSH